MKVTLVSAEPFRPPEPQQAARRLLAGEPSTLVAGGVQRRHHLGGVAGARASPGRGRCRRRPAGARRRSGCAPRRRRWRRPRRPARAARPARPGRSPTPDPQREVAPGRGHAVLEHVPAAPADRCCRRRAPRPPGCANRFGSSISAATAAAPAGSTSIFARSSRNSSARDSASSSTVRMSSTSALTWSNVRSPGRPTAIPSAIVRIDGERDRRAGGQRGRPGRRAARPAHRRSARPAAAPAGPRRRRRAARRRPCTPARWRTSGTCSRISSPTVPWPATMSGWSNGWTNSAPVALGEGRSPRRCSRRSSRRPARRWRRSRGSRPAWAAPPRSGMNTVAAMPSIDAASATPCAWLPALAATTPRARCASSSRASRVYAPRILNEPVRCRFSHFSHTGPPASSDSAREPATGVSVITPARSSRAARISSMPTGGGPAIGAWGPARCGSDSAMPASSHRSGARVRQRCDGRPGSLESGAVRGRFV